MSQNPKSFNVFQASAGSGKTYTIVKEYLKLCLASQAATHNYKHILAITFTNMATQEMKSKIVNWLNDIIQSDPSTPPKSMEADLINELAITREDLKHNSILLFNNIIHDYSSFCVYTIDAFVQKLARSFAKELHLPSQYSVSLDKDEVAEDITERIGIQIEPSNPYLTDIIVDYSQRILDNEKKTKIPASIHRYVTDLFSEDAFQKGEQNRFIDKEHYLETRSFLQSTVKEFKAKCADFVKDFEDFQQRHALNQEDFNYATNGLGPCLKLVKEIKENHMMPLEARQIGVMEGNVNWYSRAFKTKAGSGLTTVDEDFKKVFVPFASYYHDNVGRYLFYSNLLDHLSFYALRSKIKAEIENYINEEQIVHITEFNKRINEILGDFSVPFIYERIGERIKHLFIDEFQDTSVLQWQNLLPLMDNNLSDNQTNLIVGDGKQSIYRWRNGEVGQLVNLPEIFDKPLDSDAFDQYEQNLINHFKFDELKSNYRSFKNIVDFNNAFFQFVATPTYLSEENQKVYVHKDSRYGKEVSVQQHCEHGEPGLVQVELFKSPDAKTHDKEAMLERVKTIIDELHQQGFSNKDITILIRYNKTGVEIANYLNGKGVKVVSNESILLKSSDKVQLVISTLDYLIHNDNKATIAAMLYYRNVTRNQDFQGTVDGFFDKANDIAEGRTTAEEVMGLEPQALKSLLSKSYSLFDLCSSLMKAFGFNGLGDSFLNFLLDVVYNWQSADAYGIEGFLDYWDKKKHKLCVFTNSGDAVSIMTIHKSKGLEFPVVIYPFAIDNLNDKKNDTIWCSPEALGFGSIPNIDKVHFKITVNNAKWSPQTAKIVEKNNDQVRLDNINLSYVAFTRPSQRLYVLTWQNNGEAHNPLNAFMNAIPNDLNCQREETDRAITYRFGDTTSKKVEKRNGAPEPHEFFNESYATDWFGKISIDPNPSMFWIHPDDDMKPQEWGEFVHETLAEVQHRNDIEPVLKRRIDAGVMDQTTADKISSWFRQILENPLIGKAFDDQVIVKNECDILLADGNIVRPDRYAELPDSIYLLDYKTGKPLKKHQEQLQGYMNVLQTMVNKPIKAFLVYLGENLNVIPLESTSQLSIQFI